MLDHDRAKAQRRFLAATRTAPSYAPAWFDLAVLAEGRKDWPEAQRYFQQYLSLQPTGADAERARSQLALLARYTDGSLTPAVARGMEYEARVMRARAFLSHGLFREAIAEVGQAQAIDRSRWEAYAVASLAMSKQGKPEAAAKFAGIALEHAPPDKREQIRAALSPESGGAALRPSRAAGQ